MNQCWNCVKKNIYNAVYGWGMCYMFILLYCALQNWYLHIMIYFKKQYFCIGVVK